MRSSQVIFACYRRQQTASHQLVGGKHGGPKPADRFWTTLHSHLSTT
jgi:hypothetical protein